MRFRLAKSVGPNVCVEGVSTTFSPILGDSPYTAPKGNRNKEIFLLRNPNRNPTAHLARQFRTACRVIVIDEADFPRYHLYDKATLRGGLDFMQSG